MNKLSWFAATLLAVSLADANAGDSGEESRRFPNEIVLMPGHLHTEQVNLFVSYVRCKMLSQAV